MKETVANEGLSGHVGTKTAYEPCQCRATVCECDRTIRYEQTLTVSDGRRMTHVGGGLYEPQNRHERRRARALMRRQA